MDAYTLNAQGRVGWHDVVQPGLEIGSLRARECERSIAVRKQFYLEYPGEQDAQQQREESPRADRDLGSRLKVRELLVASWCALSSSRKNQALSRPMPMPNPTESTMRPNAMSIPIPRR